jgi:ribosomal protein S18 acetylase RimI-like enzyme
MPRFQGALRFSRVDQPQGSEALRHFSSGRDAHARVVNKLVKKQYNGTALHRPVIWVLQDVSSTRPRTVGVCGWRERKLHPDEHTPPQGIVYIHVIGVSARYRGQWLADDLRCTRLGHHLLAESLREILRAYPAGQMPAVWASVAQKNVSSHAMFSAFAFLRSQPGCRQKRYPGVPAWLAWTPGEIVRYVPPAILPAQPGEQSSRASLTSGLRNRIGLG